MTSTAEVVNSQNKGSEGGAWIVFSKKEMLTVTRNLKVGIHMRGDKVREVSLGSRLCRVFSVFWLRGIL